MKLRTRLVNIAAFTKLVDSVNKITRRVVFTFGQDELELVSTGDEEDGLRLHGSVKVNELFSSYCVESKSNSISFEFSTQALASVIRQTSSTPTEVRIRLGMIARTPYLGFILKTVGRSGVEYEVEQRLAVSVLRPEQALALPKLCCPVPDVHISLPKLSDVCKVAERLKSLSEFIKVSASRVGGFRLGISTEHAIVETEWRGLTLYQTTSSQDGEDGDSQGTHTPRTPRATSTFFHTIVKSRALLKFLHANAVGQVSLASICEGHCLVLYYYIGDRGFMAGTDNSDQMAGSLMVFLPAINEDGDL